MPTIEEILALLAEKFPGARKDGLEHLASGIAIQCTNIDEAKATVEKLSDDKVKGFISGWRKKADAEISKATTTHEQGLKDKYNFVEKSKTEGKEGGAGGGQKTEGPQGLTLEAIGALIDSKLTGALATVSAKEAARDYRATFETELTKAGVKGHQREMMLRNFDRANNFKDADAFNTYLEEVKTDITTLAQEQADAGLGGQAKPLFGAVNNEGVSTAVADYLASKGSDTNKLSGKEL